MTKVDEETLGASLTATIEERFLAPLKRSTAPRTWFVITVTAILALHLGVIGYLLARDRDTPVEMAKQEEIPVEVVVEPPPPPPAQKTKEEIEKPASSAPRKENEEKVETSQVQDRTEAPKAPIPPADGKPEPAKEAAAPDDSPAQQDKTEEAEKKMPDVLDKDAEALDKLKPEPKTPTKNVAQAKPKTKTKTAKTAMSQLAGLSSLPEYRFARPTRKSPVSGGSEDARYLAIVYGMIMAKRRPVPIPDDDGSVTLTFEVDDGGNVLAIGLRRSSGYPLIDAEAIAAIRRASPFPPPPVGSPHGLVATIGFGSTSPHYTMGAR